jgi:hypothetical protein
MRRIPWWQWIPFQRRWRVVGIVDEADDVPGRLPRNGGVIVESMGKRKWLVFDCPCRKGHRILLNIFADKAGPHWRIVSDASLTVSPSVDVAHGDQRCHYFIRRGKIIWATHLRGA